MTFIHHAARELHCKLVYYGPGLGGKTTNVRYIHERSDERNRGKLVSLATESDRTLFFDFLPLAVGEVRGFRTRFHLYTVPGQIFYDASRAMILKGADGVIFVADSQRERLDANIECLRDLRENLRMNGKELHSLPYVLQLNKRDTPTALPVPQLEECLRVRDEPIFESVATRGLGVLETFQAGVRRVLLHLRAA